MVVVVGWGCVCVSVSIVASAALCTGAAYSIAASAHRTAHRGRPTRNGRKLGYSDLNQSQEHLFTISLIVCVQACNRKQYHFGSILPLLSRWGWHNLAAQVWVCLQLLFSHIKDLCGQRGPIWELEAFLTHLVEEFVE